MLSLNRIFLRLLFLLHGKCLVHLIRFLSGLNFTLLSLHSGFFISYHKLLEVFHRGFLFSLQRYFSTFTFMYDGFLFSFDRILNAFLRGRISLLQRSFSTFTLLLLYKGF
jgi:hypothetical protein